MSFVLDGIFSDTEVVSDENFTVLRNDFRPVYKEYVLENTNEEFKQSFSSEKFNENIEACREAIRNSETELKDRFENYEAIANYFPGIPTHFGLIFRLASIFGSEGASIHERIFEKACFHAEDNPDREELIYRDFWNKNLLNIRIVNALVVISIFLELPPKFYTSLIDTFMKTVDEEINSTTELAKIYYREIRN